MLTDGVLDDAVLPAGQGDDWDLSYDLLVNLRDEAFHVGQGDEVLLSSLPVDAHLVLESSDSPDLYSRGLCQHLSIKADSNVNLSDKVFN